MQNEQGQWETSPPHEGGGGTGLEAKPPPETGRAEPGWRAGAKALQGMLPQGGLSGCLPPGGRRREMMDPRASFRRTLVPKRIWDHSSSFTGVGGWGGGKAAANVHPGTSAPAQKSALSVSGSN